jgi:hypothetical protein
VFVPGCGDVDRGSDVKRELAIAGDVGAVRQYWLQHHSLPPSLAATGFEVPMRDVRPIDYRPLDATRFQLAVKFDGPRSPSEGGALGPAFAHPAGLVRYTFDAGSFNASTEDVASSPVAVDPPPAGH